MPVTKNFPDWANDIAKPFLGVQYVYLESGFIHGQTAVIRLKIMPYDVKYSLDQTREEAEDTHLKKAFEVALQCVKLARETYNLIDFNMTISFGRSTHVAVDADLELTFTERKES